MTPTLQDKTDLLSGARGEQITLRVLIPGTGVAAILFRGTLLTSPIQPAKAGNPMFQVQGPSGYIRFKASELTNWNKHFTFITITPTN